MTMLFALACQPIATLTDPEAFDIVTDAPVEDLFEPPCEIWWVGDGLVETSTALCGLLSIGQPLLDGLQAGERLETTIDWDVLQAEVPAEAHIALWVGQEVVAERWLSVPGPAGFERITWSVRRDVAKGTQMGWHLHNHGENTYRFGPLRRRN
ncbi:MAG: hypothetical protein AAGA48_31080 [Myxococcota bacterium]